MPSFESRLNKALWSLHEAGRLHGPRHTHKPYGSRGGRGGSGRPRRAEREVSKHSLRFKFDDTVLAMAEVEAVATGQRNDQLASDWFTAQFEDKPGTAAAARRRIDEVLRMTPGRAVDMDEGLTQVAIIYGVAGNRWKVYLNGLVVFDSTYASSGGAINKARELGFDVD